jgi:UDP-N-acetylmuramoyl-L-alanyl-D-glutamate--2,6-diaminopimelate ligase
MGVRGIVKKFVPTKTFKKIEPLGHLGEAVLFNTINGFPIKNLKVIGITGTNGKTSTASIVHRMLHEAGYKVGLMTTVSYGVGLDIKKQFEHTTTPGGKKLINRIKEMKSQGMEWLVLETTSHALAQHRVWGVPYTVAVLTNLTHEHLDYHGTFENYRDAKRLMFQMCNANKNGLRTGIVNADDDNAKYFVADIANPVTYGMKEGDLRARSVRLTPAGSRYIVRMGDDEYHIHCRLPGSFNVYNSLAAVGVGRALGLSVKQIQDGIEALEGVEGRMTHIEEGQEFDVIVDYAHTPDSYEKLFKDLKPVLTGRLIVMFGSAGRRDEAKRAVQGELAGKYADEIIITEEDDRDMDGEAIMKDIVAGAEKAGKQLNKNVFMVHDRTEAIQTTVNRAKKGDTVLLLGKGHEKDILRNGPRAAELRHLQQDDHNPDRVVEVAWDEIAEARKALKSRNKA